MAALIALGYWGYTAHGGPVMRIGFAVLAPMTVALFWGTFVAPKAALSLQPWLKQALALVVFALASSTLAARGHGRLGLVFLIVSVLNALALMFSTPEP